MISWLKTSFLWFVLFPMSYPILDLFDGFCRFQASEIHVCVDNYLESMAYLVHERWASCFLMFFDSRERTGPRGPSGLTAYIEEIMFFSLNEKFLRRRKK